MEITNELVNRLFHAGRGEIEAILKDALSAAPVVVKAEPVAWVREGFLEELHKDGTHSGMQTVLWLDEENPGKRHSKRIPIYTSPPDLAAENARLREALERIAGSSPRSRNLWNADETFAWAATLARAALKGGDA